MIYYEIISHSSHRRSGSWTSPPIPIPPGRALRAVAALINFAVTYDHGDHPLSELVCLTSASVTGSSAGSGTVHVTWCGTLRDASSYATPVVHAVVPTYVDSGLGRGVHGDDSSNITLTILVIATTDPDVVLHQEIVLAESGTPLDSAYDNPWEGRTILRFPPFVGERPPVRRVHRDLTGHPVAVLMSGFLLHYHANQEHHVQEARAQLSWSQHPGTTEVAVEGKLGLRDSSSAFDDSYAGWIAYVLLELPAHRYGIHRVSGTMGPVTDGRAAGLQPSMARPPVAPGVGALIASMSGFAVGFRDAGHHVRTIMGGVGDIERDAAGARVPLFGGIAHQDHWREPYWMECGATVLHGAIGTFADAINPPPITEPAIRGVSRGETSARLGAGASSVEATAMREGGWDRCVRCGSLYSTAYGERRCAVGGGVHVGRRCNYRIVKGTAPSGTQSGWARCSRCSCILQTATGVGLCGAGEHDVTSSPRFAIHHSGTHGPMMQSGWRYCATCKTLVHPEASLRCARGTAHDSFASGPYFVELEPTAGDSLVYFVDGGVLAWSAVAVDGSYQYIQSSSGALPCTHVVGLESGRVLSYSATSGLYAVGGVVSGTWATVGSRPLPAGVSLTSITGVGADRIFGLAPNGTGFVFRVATDGGLVELDRAPGFSTDWSSIVGMDDGSLFFYRSADGGSYYALVDGAGRYRSMTSDPGNARGWGSVAASGDLLLLSDGSGRMAGLRMRLGVPEAPRELVSPPAHAVFGWCPLVVGLHDGRFFALTGPGGAGRGATARIDAELRVHASAPLSGFGTTWTHLAAAPRR